MANRLKKAINNPRLLLEYFVKHSKICRKFDDEKYIKLLYRVIFCRKLDLDNPQSFNEKIQWLKLYDRKPEYTRIVDKDSVKGYVANIIGQEYIIPTLGVWDKPEDIDWEVLPERFVLKTTHGGGNTGVVICKDKAIFDRDRAIDKLNRSLKQDIYQTLREWPYKNVPRRIIAEQFIDPDPEQNELTDYKFFCFNGNVKSLFIATERSSDDVKFDFFDADFNHLDLYQIHPMSGKTIPKPDGFEEMKTIAANLSKGFPHVRIDLYNVKGKIYFGEITFYHHSGLVPFHPDKWDFVFGSWIKLPARTN